MFKVNNINVRRTSWRCSGVFINFEDISYLFQEHWKRYEISSKLTIKTPEQCYWRRSDVFMLTLNIFIPFPTIFIVNFD